MPHKSRIGLMGEKVASDYLQKKGFKIITTNYFTRDGEVDLICLDNNCLVFVEVKARTEYSRGLPYEAITTTKLHKIRKVMFSYLNSNKSGYNKYRIDVITIEYDGSLYIKKINHYSNISFDDIN